MEHRPARTIDALRVQVATAGWDRRGLDRLMDAYQLALEAHPHVVLSSGRPMTSHGVGTASLAVTHGLGADAVLAALVHTVPHHGRTRAAWSSRALLHRRIASRLGPEVAGVCQAYDHCSLEGGPRGPVPATGPERDALALRVLSRLDQLTDAGPTHRSDVARSVASAVAAQDQLAAWATALGLAGVDAVIRHEVELARSLAGTALGQSSGRWGDGTAVVNDALRVRRSARWAHQVKDAALTRSRRLRVVASRITRRPEPATVTETVPQSPPTAAVPTGGPAAWPAGRTVVVVGHGRIGRALADQCQAGGAVVHRIDHNPRHLDGVHGPGVHLVADVTDETELARAWDRICADSVPEVAFITIGGASRQQRLVDLDAARWQRTLTTNLVAPALVLSRFAATRVQAGGGGVAVLFGSVHGERATTVTDYGAAKAAISKLVVDAATELAADGIRVFGVAPNWVELDDHGQVRFDPSDPVRGTSIPPEEVARLTMALAAPDANLSGQMVRIDNAHSVRHPSGWR